MIEPAGSRRPRRRSSSAVAADNIDDWAGIATSGDATATSHDIALSPCRVSRSFGDSLNRTLGISRDRVRRTAAAARIRREGASRAELGGGGRAGLAWQVRHQPDADVGLMSAATMVAIGTSSCSNSSRFGPNSTSNTVAPVRLLPGQLSDKPRLDRIEPHREDNWNRRGRRLGRWDRRAIREDRGHPTASQFRRQCRKSIIVRFGPPVFDQHVAAFDARSRPCPSDIRWPDCGRPSSRASQAPGISTRPALCGLTAVHAPRSATPPRFRAP
jgi:hypothetical protein